MDLPDNPSSSFQRICSLIPTASFQTRHEEFRKRHRALEEEKSKFNVSELFAAKVKLPF